MSVTDHPKARIPDGLVEGFLIAIDGWTYELRDWRDLRWRSPANRSFKDRYRYRRAKRRLRERASERRPGLSLVLEARDVYERTIIKYTLDRLNRGVTDVLLEGHRNSNASEFSGAIRSIKESFERQCSESQTLRAK